MPFTGLKTLLRRDPAASFPVTSRQSQNRFNIEQKSLSVIPLHYYQEVAEGKNRAVLITDPIVMWFHYIRLSREAAV